MRVKKKKKKDPLKGFLRKSEDTMIETFTSGTQHSGIEEQ